MSLPAPKLQILRRELTRTGTGQGAPPAAERSRPAAPAARLSDWARLVRRVRARRMMRAGKWDRMRIAPRAVRLPRLAECVPGKCPSAEAMPGSPRAKCLAKGCGCDDLHAVRTDAKCPRRRWAKPPAPDSQQTTS